MHNPAPGQRWRAKKDPNFVVVVESITWRVDRTTVYFEQPGHPGGAGVFSVEGFLDLYEMV